MATQDTEAKKEKKEKMVTVHLPKAARGEDNFQFVGLNGATFLVKKGEDVEVPAGVAEILENSEAMQKQADEFIDEKAN